jgi:hypothetical protein
MDPNGAKEMLYQLTTHLFNPGSKTNKVDYYEVLGLSRTASSKVKTLNPKPKPETRNPKPETLISKPYPKP